jgi:hypothetical protein
VSAPVVEVAETCRCGASTTAKVATVRTARTLIREWRDTHPCTTRDDERERFRTGASAVVSQGPRTHVGFNDAAEIQGPYRW